MANLTTATLKAWQLKHWAFLTGVATTGTKADIRALLQHRMNESLVPDYGGKIISVDMGIRNLAFCAVEAPSLNPSPEQRIKVSTWKRMDLLGRSPISESSEEVSSDGEAKERRRKRVSATIPKDAFTPASLSKTALTITEELLSYSPSAILIERQRFRSGGASAIQEWTVRVNMLESMLWASLETLRSVDTSNHFPSVYAISPQRVTNFWAAGRLMDLRLEDSASEGKEMETLLKTALGGRKKVEKKTKIDLVKSWVSAAGDVQLEFAGDAASIAKAFKLDQRQGREAAGGKLDDLADCLLQAVAWVRWEENKRKLKQSWQDP